MLGSTVIEDLKARLRLVAEDVFVVKRGCLERLMEDYGEHQAPAMSQI